MSPRALIQRPVPVTASLVLNPLMAPMAEAAGFPSISALQAVAGLGPHRPRRGDE